MQASYRRKNTFYGIKQRLTSTSAPTRQPVSTGEETVSPFRTKGKLLNKLWTLPRISREQKKKFVSNRRSPKFYDLDIGSQRQLFQPCFALAAWRRTILKRSTQLSSQQSGNAIINVTNYNRTNAEQTNQNCLTWPCKSVLLILLKPTDSLPLHRDSI